MLMKEVFYITADELLIMNSITEDTTLHLSLGKYPHDEIEAVKEQTQNNWEAFSFTLSEIYLLSKGNPEKKRGDTYIIRKTIPLGNNNIPPIFNPIPFEVNDLYNRSLHFKHISKKVTKEQLIEAFVGFEIESINITLNNDGKSRGWGIISFVDTEQRDQALKSVIMLKGKILNTILCK